MSKKQMGCLNHRENHTGFSLMKGNYGIQIHAYVVLYILHLKHMGKDKEKNQLPTNHNHREEPWLRGRANA